MRYHASQEVLSVFAGDVTITYNGTEINTITKVVGEEAYVRTFTWVDGNITHITDWIRQ